MGACGRRSHGGQINRLCIQIIRYPLVELSHRYPSRCGRLEDVEETKSWLAGRIFLSSPCRDCIDQKALRREAFSTRAVLVVESMGCPKGADPNEHSHVYPGWSADWMVVAMERAVGSCRNVNGNRASTAGEFQRPV